uniref:Uncharacterized protein n=1 Tax=Tanacetum cinerariifolium TaxID=118510 RepID=A0A6L2MCD7_TANCI|nr:hypothetical protein [Tanacetum cinerariifolium]
MKAEKEKLKEELKKLLNPATLKAQAQKWTEHEERKAKMMKEYKYQISFRANPPPITKISYVVNSKNEATMKIARGGNPLNLIVHPNFRLKTLGFSEWLEVHALASKKSAEEKKKKRIEFLKEAFVTEDIKVDGMDINLIPPPKVIPIQEIKLSVEESLSAGLRGKEDHLSARHQLAVKGLSECKASKSNIRRIQIKDIVKEVKDYLKTYSSAGMDTS